MIIVRQHLNVAGKTVNAREHPAAALLLLVLPHGMTLGMFRTIINPPAPGKLGGFKGGRYPRTTGPCTLVNLRHYPNFLLASLSFISPTLRWPSRIMTVRLSSSGIEEVLMESILNSLGSLTTISISFRGYAMLYNSFSFRSI